MKLEDIQRGVSLTGVVPAAIITVVSAGTRALGEDGASDMPSTRIDRLELKDHRGGEGAPDSWSQEPWGKMLQGHREPGSWTPALRGEVAAGALSARV